ncbi:MAG: bifunctional phosphopantothenoylcysteine decarboxylase/phosphopantothenate--cysteine ligase CoaBC [Nitrolancea sp.]
MSRLLNGKHVVLGVSGGIAAYKAIELARDLTLAGALVDVMLTQSTLEFVKPLPFQTLTQRKVYTQVFEPWTDELHGHISMAERADVMLVAPATADMIAKLAHGLADDMLTVSALACTAPLIVAPAMDHNMYLHPATQENLRILRQRGVRIIGPEQGALASGAIGYGRLVPIPRLVDAVRLAAATSGRLSGRRVVVSAGPTREKIDPIRYVTNRSSGKMGYAIAEAFLDEGAFVTLVSGATALPPPNEATFVSVESAEEMYLAVDDAVRGAAILVMAAAVADYRPRQVAEHKIKKSEADLVIEMERTRDILASVHQPGLIKVGFAAETEQLLESARDKLSRKSLDMIVANIGPETMGSDMSRAFFIRRESDPEELPQMSKTSLAEAIVDRVVALVESRA